MAKYFNTEEACYPAEHYMVNLDTRTMKIKALVDHRKYFSINRGRQYGKTTTLNILSEKLREQYSVFYINFEGLSDESFENTTSFCQVFSGLLYFNGHSASAKHTPNSYPPIFHDTYPLASSQASIQEKQASCLTAADLYPLHIHNSCLPVYHNARQSFPLRPWMQPTLPSAVLS